MGWKKFRKKVKKKFKKVGRKLKRGVKKLGQNLKKYGPKLLQVGSMFIPGGGLLGKALGKLGGGGGFFGKMLGKLGGKGGGFLSKLRGKGGGGFFKRAFGGGLGKGTGLFGKAGGFLSGGGKLSQMFGGGGGFFGKMRDRLDPSGDGLFGGGQLRDKFQSMMGGGGGGMGGLLSAGLGAYGAMQSPDLAYDTQSIQNYYKDAMEKQQGLTKHYKDMMDPESAQNKKYMDMLQGRSMDQAQMQELAAERRMGGVTSGMEREQMDEIQDNQGEVAHRQFQDYMMGQQGRSLAGQERMLGYDYSMGDKMSDFEVANQRYNMQNEQQKYGAINQIGGGLLDYGMEQFT